MIRHINPRALALAALIFFSASGYSQQKIKATEECIVVVSAISINGEPILKATEKLAEDLQLQYNNWTKPLIHKPPVGTWSIGLGRPDPENLLKIIAQTIPRNAGIPRPKDYDHPALHQHENKNDRRLSFEIFASTQGSIIRASGHDYKKFSISYPQAFPLPR